MKTTFKTVFTELDDELMNLDIQENAPVDIDIEKIKSEVFMQINDENKTKKKYSKKFIVILAAAVILVGSTIGAFATGTIQAIFKGYFKGAEVNDLGLYNGGNVEVQSDDYDVKLLGVMSDGEVAYSAMEITRKDGSPFVEEGYYISSSLDTFVKNSYEFSLDGGDQLDGGAIARGRCSLSEDRRTLSIYTDYVRGGNMEQATKDFRVTFHCTAINGYKLDKILYTEDLPEVLSNDGLTEERGGEEYETEAKLESLREENGLTEEECIWVHHEGKTVYAKGEEKQFELVFDISFDINSTVDNQIERDINSENAPNVVKDYTSNAKIKISPLGISLTGECDEKYDKQMPDWGSRCFEIPDTDGKSKVTMDDGTVYYILVNEGGERRTDDSGVFHENAQLQYSATEEMAWDLGSNRIIIDLDKVQSVIINGDTIYRK
ncbi:hypothetical protein [Ruminococcus bovis]|jgi:hypothetical protein|uniref:DUF4179 domain-containing protein n=1 Tax=Ruminococcus bovis TaxID=2564099 RepID=A0A4P8XVU7_9FIRM|nr:hypothetical protein [Ruminococcus bovis]QCT07261.1 hypothetical protein E5Z56_07770 [Ruminococcus bovis]